ncbi:MAG: cadherin-like domain-containing protein [Deinococcota bacterium]
MKTCTPLGLMLLSVMLLSWVSAEGSATLYPAGVGGDRAFLRTRDAAEIGSGSESRVKVFARAGETINLASSAQQGNGIAGTGSITWTAPDGTTGNCNGLPAGVGFIANRAEELAGPGAGYTPCVVNVGTDGPAGVWIIDFDGPDTTDGGNQPPDVPADDPWTQPALGDNADNTVAAWDITVCPGVGPCDTTTDIEGRVYFNRFDGILSGNGPSLEVIFNVLTDTGYQYTVDTNEIDPFGFSFFVNNKGIRDGAGNPLYASAPVGGNIQDPEGPDDLTNVTHKIFLNTPSPDLPLSAPISGGTTWLLTSPIIPTASNLTFTGIEGTAGQTGTDPLSGTFRFDSGIFTGSYTVVLDLNNNGTYGDGNDRILSGNTSAAGINEAVWDGLDGNGVAVAATTAAINISAQVNLQAGQIHFPIQDAENSPNGLVITRINGPGIVPETRSFYNGAGLAGGTPPDPISCSHLPIATNVPANQPCNGLLLQDWDNNWGNNRIIDTWAFTDVPPVILSTSVNIVQADLRVDSKTAVPLAPVVGQPVTYTVVIANGGPSGVRNATFRDVFPAGVANIQFTGATTTGTAVSRASTGAITSPFTDTVDLANGATITYTFTAIVQAANIGDPLTNTASILRPADVNDPDATDPNMAVPTDVTAECIAAGNDPAGATPCNNIVVNTIFIGATASPVAFDDSATTSLDTPVTFSATDNDTDFDGTIDTATVDLDPGTGGQQTTFVVAGEGTFDVDAAGNVTFTPEVGFLGTSSIPYTVEDNSGLLSNQATLTVNVAALGPRARNDRDLDNPLGTEVTLNVVDNDRDGDFPINPATVDLDPLSPGIQETFTVAGEGTYTVDNAGNVTFTPEANFNEDPTPITYTVSDTQGNPSNRALIFISYAPEAVDDENSTPPDTTVTTDVLANDLGDFDPTTIQLIDPTTGNPDPDGFFIIAGEGTYTLEPDGTVTFDPLPTFTGATSGVDYQVQDADGNITQATLTITVQ